MTSPSSGPRVIPAHLSFLSIYNPSLGHTDDTFRDQILFYHSHADREARIARKNDPTRVEPGQDELREQENERLRQIGLAQGMVAFARTFSEGSPADSVETGKSRIVLKELEEGWWIIAKVELTRLPKLRGLDSAGKAKGADEDEYEYSGREVSPPSLLLRQIQNAHRIFLLHQGESLQALLDRVGKVKLSLYLERYWGRFCRNWEVLLHGNPASDVLDGLKLSAGGELGMGVGEEEWGSGERAVLEDLVHSTEGLNDLVVSRFGEPDGDTSEEVNKNSDTNIPWLGRGQPPDSADGLIFGGTGRLSRASVKDISIWMQQIYTFGEYAYGIRDNPSRKRRKIPQRSSMSPSKPSPARPVVHKGQDGIGTTPEAQEEPKEAGSKGQNEAPDKAPSTPGLPLDPRPALHERVASQDHAPGSPGDPPKPVEDHRPGIPPPIIRSAEQALRDATVKVSANDNLTTSTQADRSSTFGVSNDKWVKYLTLGLSTLSKPAAPEDGERPSGPSRSSTASSKTIRPSAAQRESMLDAKRQVNPLREVEPMPDGHLVEAQIAKQKRLENEGYFLVGYRGSLGCAAPSDPLPSLDEGVVDGGDRTVLRTVHVQVVKNLQYSSSEETLPDSSSTSTYQNDSIILEQERMRVLVYVRRPFIYTFLFEQRHSSLQMSSFYSELHNHLAPLQKSMSLNTSATSVNRRIQDAKEDSLMESTEAKKTRHLPVYDLMYDPVRLTIHSSIPNIPLPGTLAAEGIAATSPSDAVSTWTRIESLNVHSQILTMLEAASHSAREIEKSAKTSRGWWVVWMRLPPSTHARTTDQGGGSITPVGSAPATSGTTYVQPDVFDTDQCRVAVLVRKASDWTPPKKQSGSRNFPGMMGWGSRQGDSTGGSNAGWGPANLAGGMGFDPRRYVESLLSLNR